MQNDKRQAQTTLDYLAEERWIPDWSSLWPEIAALQRQGLVRIRWEETRNSTRAMVLAMESARANEK